MELSRVDPEATTTLLTELIESGHGTSPEASWRAAVEVHGQNSGEGPLDWLLCALRDALAAQVEDSDRLGPIFRDLRSRPQQIFTRLALHLLCLHGAQDLDLVMEASTDLDLLGEAAFRHEAMEMLNAQFAALDEEQRKEVLEAVSTSCSPQTLTAIAMANGRELESDATRDLAEWELLKWLSAIGSEQLPPESRDILRRLSEAHGEPSHPSFSTWWWTGSGDRSPRTKQQLAAMLDGDLLEYLREWQPSTEGRIQDTKEGLAEALRKTISLDPRRFIELADDFEDLESRYVSSLFWALGDAGRRDALDLGPALNLAERVLGNQDIVTARAVGHLLEYVLSVPSQIEASSLQRAWRCTRRLLIWADESEEQDPEGDWLAWAINRVRGRALESTCSLFRYLQELEDDDSAFLADVANAIRERVKLERSAQLSVVARSFNNLFVADAAFASEIAIELFGQKRQQLFGIYLHWNKVSGPTFDALSSFYLSALQSLGNDEDHDSALGRHLFRVVLWEKLDTSELRRYLEGARAAARKNALGELGRTISNTEELAAHLVAKLQGIWELSFSTFTSIATTDELTEFGWWFVSEVLPIDWRLSNLEAVLQKTNGLVDWEHKVIETLADQSARAPEQVAAILRLLIKGGRIGYSLGREDLGRAIRSLLDSESKAAGAELVSILAAQGQIQYLSLLSSSKSEDGRSA